MRNAWVIARREYNQYFSTTVSYAVAFDHSFDRRFDLCPGFQSGYSKRIQRRRRRALLLRISKIVAEWFTIMLVLTVPALTMRLISDENRMGTLELLLTAPLQDWELIVGKWLGGLLFLLTVLAVTLIYPIILNIYETPGTNLQWQVLSLIILIHCPCSYVLEFGHWQKDVRLCSSYWEFGSLRSSRGFFCIYFIDTRHRLGIDHAPPIWV